MVARIKTLPELERLSVPMGYSAVPANFLHGPAALGQPYLRDEHLEPWRESLALQFSNDLPHLQQIFMLGSFPDCAQATREHSGAEAVVMSGNICTMTQLESFPCAVFD
ncbi:hypothetical protein AUP68_03192 [Ilyonectria robusta]